MATHTELMAARIYLRAVFPVMKVVLADVPTMKKKLDGVTADIQFSAKDDGGDIGAYLQFQDENLEIVQGFSDNPSISFGFKSVAGMNARLAGKPVIPLQNRLRRKSGDERLR